MSRHERGTRSTLCLAATLAFAGCSVLTIDVDVYKGPLSDHEHVQIERLAALAIGAKPLLVELRDRIEWPRQDREDLLHCDCWYEPDFIASDEGEPEECQCGQCDVEWIGRFSDERAFRVNQVLSLYKDRKTSTGDRLFNRGRRALEDYRRAFDRFEGSRAADQRLWDDNVVPSAADYRNLSEAYHSLIVNKQQTRLARDWGIDTSRAGANEAFARIQSGWNNRSLEADIDLLPTIAEGKVRLLKRAREVTSGFLECRAALHELLVVVLEGIEYVPESTRLSDLERAETIQSLADVALALIQPKYVGTLLRYGDSDAAGNATLEDLSATLRAAATDSIDRAAVKEALRDRLIQEPRQTAEALLRLDRYARSDGASVASKAGPPETMWSTEYWSQGLARGPMREKDLANIDPDSMQARLEKSMNLLQMPFDRGRIDRGIESLTEDYLNAVYAGERDDPAVSARQEQLFDALIRFAEKLLFIANNDRLMDSAGWGGVSYSVASLIVRLTAGQGTWESLLGSGGTDSYIRLLQAVGNSILIQADELNHLDSYRDQQQRRFRSELMAMNSVRNLQPHGVIQRLSDYLGQLKATSNPAPATSKALDEAIAVLKASMPDEDALNLGASSSLEVVDRLVVQLEQKRTKETDAAEKEKLTGAIETIRRYRFAVVTLEESHVSDPDARAVFDGYIATLYYQRFEQIKRHGDQSKVAKNLASALEAARDRRESMIHLRPPSAFLRSSFPASTLQDDPGLTWTNMLAGHGVRSIPGAQFLRDIINPEGRQSALINAEIDKQFWQNINRVRVAGGGDTNYVVAKDDVGNWYVKNYSADPKDIVRSARNLAMFGLGAQMNTDLLSRVQLDQINGTLDDPSAAAQVDAQLGPLGKLLAEYTREYNSRTATDAGKLKELLGTGPTDGVSGLLISLYGNLEQTKAPEYVERLKSGIEAAATGLTDTRAAVSAQTEPGTDMFTKGRVLLDGLHALRRYHNAVQAAIRELPSADRKAVTDQATAIGKLETEIVALEKQVSHSQTRVNEQTAFVAYLKQALSQAAGASATPADDPEPLVNAQDQLAKDIDDLNGRKEELKAREDDLTKARATWLELNEKLAKAEQAAMVARRETTRLMRPRLLDLTRSRQDVADDLEDAMRFLQKAVLTQDQKGAGDGGAQGS